MPVAVEQHVRSLAELEAERPLVEAMIGRELRAAEQAIDVFVLDRALNAAKAELVRAIEAEKRRAIRRTLREGWVRWVRIEVTRAMLEPLERLYRLGRREARAELERHGFLPARTYAADPKYERLRSKGWFLRGGLVQLSRRVERDLTAVDLETASQAAIATALYRVPGARDLASRLVSGALTDGLAATFEANSELAGGFEYTAVLDGGTCPSCEALDGEVFDSWDAIQEVLPDGGPNPDCDGEERCRCRPVPVPA